MPRIFISYRRDDSADMAGRLYDRLSAHFGRESVFFDIDAIPLGVDFRQHLGDAVGQCDFLLAIIGERWPGRGDGASSRLDSPQDFVRIEIEAALSRGIPVVPVLVGRGGLPGADALPPSLADLAYRQAIRVDSGVDFHNHVGRLIRAIEQAGTKLPQAAPPPVVTQEPAHVPASAGANAEKLPTGRRLTQCSFCGKSSTVVGPMVEGPGDVYICANCVELAYRIIEQEKQKLRNTPRT